MVSEVQGTRVRRRGTVSVALCGPCLLSVCTSQFRHMYFVTVSLVSPPRHQGERITSSPFYSCGKKVHLGQETCPRFPRVFARGQAHLGSSSPRTCSGPGLAKEHRTGFSPEKYTCMQEAKNEASFTLFQILDKLSFLESSPQ